jgi:hypothetical protein
MTFSSECGGPCNESPELQASRLANCPGAKVRTVSEPRQSSVRRGESPSEHPTEYRVKHETSVEAKGALQCPRLVPVA